MDRLLYMSLLAIMTGTCAAFAWDGAWLILAGLGFVGCMTVVTLYLWASLSGRIDPFPIKTHTTRRRSD